MEINSRTIERDLELLRKEHETWRLYFNKSFNEHEKPATDEHLIGMALVELRRRYEELNESNILSDVKVP